MEAFKLKDEYRRDLEKAEKADALFRLKPKAMAIGGKTAEENFTANRKIIAEEFASDKDYRTVLRVNNIAIKNYNDYFKDIIEPTEKDSDILNTASVDECLVYLTFCMRDDYWAGGFNVYTEERVAAINKAKARIIKLAEKL